MSMTEQEIRADERQRVINEVWGLKPFLRGDANATALFVVRFLKGMVTRAHIPIHLAADQRPRRPVGAPLRSLYGDLVPGSWADEPAEPEPKITIKWFDHPWDSHHWVAKPVKVSTPPKDWRDVPVTAGMVEEAYGRNYPELAHPIIRAAIMRAAKAKVAPEAVLDEAARKGYP